MFRTYGDQYKVDYLVMAAQGYQESGLDQSVRSGVSAIGVMQLMPATGKEQGVGDITQIEPNIHAGVKYFRFMMDTFYKDDAMDDLNKGLMTLAFYNAGPGRIRQLRAETAPAGTERERLVRERGAGGIRPRWPGDGAIRREHLRVLRGVQARHRTRRGAGRCQGRRA